MPLGPQPPRPRIRIHQQAVNQRRNAHASRLIALLVLLLTVQTDRAQSDSLTVGGVTREHHLHVPRHVDTPAVTWMLHR